MNDEERFTEGDCHYLARAIHRRTGWDMAAFDCNGPDLHAFALMPDGRLIDIYGVQTKRAAKKRWNADYPISKFTWDELSVFGSPAFAGTERRARDISRHLVAAASQGEEE